MNIKLKYLFVACTMLLLGGVALGQNDASADSTRKGEAVQLKSPDNVEKTVVYDEETQRYVVKETIAGEDYSTPSSVGFEDFWDEKNKEAEKEYWQEKSNEGKQDDPSITAPIDIDKPLNSIFGSNFVEIKPQGAAELIFGVTSQKTENPLIRVEDQTTTNFDFDQKIQLNVTGIIGEKLKISTNYNTEASFDFENQIKLEYEGDEDEIIKKIELGHVSMPLNTTLIKGSQSLFGIKSTLQFGKLRMTSILSQQKSQTQSQEITGGVQKKTVELTADNYDDNRHFYLAQYFHDEYDNSMAELPVVQSPIQINRMEVWITNIGVNTNPDARNIIALMDLGERQTYDGSLNASISSIYPDNTSNNLYSDVANDLSTRTFVSASGTLISSYGYEAGVNFEKIENARKLDPNEYTFHSQLGYISLNRKVEDNEVLAVAYEYTVPGESHPRQVGEFSTDVSDINNTMFLKLLKSTQVNNTKLPLWDLMMKNVYSTGQYGIDAATLDIDIYYNNPKTNNDINYLPANNPVNGDQPIRWLELLNMDQLDPQLNRVPDGRYDIIEGLTVRLKNGRIYFPVNEPFGSFLREKINDEEVSNLYAFDSLYHVPKWKAKNEYPDKNRFKVMVRFESKSSSIRLNAFNIPKGAVTVTAGGRQLVEGVDYRVDYNSAEVTILNQSILNSNTPIKVDVENNSLFAVTNKTLFGTHLDYQVSKDWTIGGTIFNLTESPLRNKTNQGDEPISNTIWGLNTNYAVESPYLTKLVDKIPFIDTKAASKIEASAEFAQLIPGSPSAIENEGEALTYIDDFEAGQINITVKDRSSWILASTPQGQTGVGEWPEGNLTDSLDYGFNRAKLSWYNVDPLFYDNQSNTPSHIVENEQIQFNHYMRTIPQSELFPNRSLAVGEALNLLTLDVSFFPQERGPYNFDTQGGSFSAGIDKTTGLLNDPASRWGGMMRQVRNVDFETQNIEFLEFWVMSPFLNEDGDLDAIGGNQSGGDVYLHLGNISEDVLRDGRKGFENGLPSDGDNSIEVDTTNWGRVATKINLVTAFDNDPDTRLNQDVGFDGLSNENETNFFSDYLSYFDGGTPASIAADPSGDDYEYFRGDDFDNAEADIVERYKGYTGMDGNSPTQEQTGLSYNSTSTNTPDIEDVNRDNTLSEGESYYEYKISMRPEDLENSDIGTNYLNQVYNTTATNPSSGATKPVTWYQFRIPVRQPDKVVGSISDFQAIRFMRMALKDWTAPTVIRFATIDFVQSRWRSYADELFDEEDNIAPSSSTIFNVGSVNLEEDSKKAPVRYIMPPDIQRQFNIATRSQENEQAMQLKVCDLEGGDARAMYKLQNFDLLSYNELLMNVHAEQTGDAVQNLDDMNMSVFIRLGTDFNENYYEYEVPLVFTDPEDVSATSDESAEKEIWKSENLLDFDYKEVFSGLKAERNNLALTDADQYGSLSLSRYSKADEGNTAVVKGSPSLQQVKVIMIGVKNKNGAGTTRCAELWVNELRLSGFDKTGGWATTANVNMQLADLGNVSLGGGYSTPGWGSIDQKVSDRAREHTRNIDATGSLEMGKFFPEKVGLSIPLYLGYNEIKKTPQYNPLDTDIKIKELDKNSDYRKYLDTIVTDMTQSRSINLSNVRKLPKGNKKLKVYSIENFDATYAVSDKRHRDVNTEFANVKNYQGALNYKFKLRPKAVEPFKRTPIMNKVQKKREKRYDNDEKELKDSIAAKRKVDPKSKEIKLLETELKELRVEKKDYKKRMAKLKRSPYLRLYRDFNFYYLPKSFAVKNDMNRMFSANKVREVTDPNIDLLIDTTFNKNWYYNRTYRLDYNLTKAIKLDYSAQRKAFIDEPFGAIDTKEDQDSIWRSIRQNGGGRPTLYTQTTNANWKIPINKFPWTNWISSSVKYSGKYDWQAAPLSTDQLGNNISNSNTKQLTGQFNMINLYNKVPYLKKLNRRRRPKPKPKAEADTTKKEKKPAITGRQIVDATVRGVMSLRNVSFTYSQNNGTFLPGYRGNADLIGMDVGRMAPGYGFVFGSQRDILAQGVEDDWFSDRYYEISQRVSHTNKESLSLRATVEPFKKFRVNLTGQRQQSTTNSYFYQIDDDGKLSEFSPQETGTFTITINSISTAFDKIDEEGFSESFRNMESYRSEFSKRLAENNPLLDASYVPADGEYSSLYDEKQTEVILYSFLAAYTGKSPSRQKISRPGEFVIPNKIPIPNWSLNYNGLIGIPIIKRYFSSFTLSHRYKSTLNFNGYQNNLSFRQGNIDLDNEGNVETFTQFQNVDVSINEQFGPLGKIDMRLKNSILANFELRKSRTVGLNFGRNTVTEQKSFDIIVGGGYVFKDLVLPIKVAGKRLKSNLDLKTNVGVKTSSLTLMEIDGAATTTQGSRIINISFTGDYIVTKQITVRAFYTQTLNNPFIATSYPTSSASGGLSIRFTL